MGRSKYHATKTPFAGRVYDSKMEAARAADLACMVEAGLLRAAIPQPGTIFLGLPENKYRPDFLVIHSDGAWVYEDVKGQETAAFKKNKRLWSEYGPGTLIVTRQSGKRFKVIEEIVGPSHPLRTVASCADWRGSLGHAADTDRDTIQEAVRDAG